MNNYTADGSGQGLKGSKIARPSWHEVGQDLVEMN